jgi:hypothetical protein
MIPYNIPKIAYFPDELKLGSIPQIIYKQFINEKPKSQSTFLKNLMFVKNKSVKH